MKGKGTFRFIFRWARGIGGRVLQIPLIFLFVWPSHLTLANDHADKGESETQELERFKASIDHLDKVLAGEGGSHSLDTFRLLNQQVVLERDVIFLKASPHKKKILKIRVLDPDERELDEIFVEGEPAKPFELDLDRYPRESSLEVYFQGRMIEIINDPKHLRLFQFTGSNVRVRRLTYTGENIVLEREHLPVQKPYRVHPGKISVHVFSPTGKLVDTLDARKFRKSTKPSFSRMTPDAYPEGSTFEIWYQDQRLHSFNIPIKQALFYGPYLFFIEQNSFNAETGVHNLCFIDLEYFTSALGRSDLGVYRIPIQNFKSDSPLHIESGRLWLAKTPLPLMALQHFSAIQEVAFNVTAALVNPATYDANTDLVEDFLKYFEEAARLAGEDVGEQVRGILGSDLSSSDFLTELTEHLRYRAKTGPVGKKAKALEVADASVRDYHERLIQEESFQASLNAIAKNQVAQRKLFARLKMLWGRLSQPNPLGARSIKPAMAIVAGGLTEPEVDLSRPLEGRAVRNHILNHRYIRWGVPIAAAATLGVLYPEAVSQFVFLGLDTCRTVLNTVFGPVAGAAMDTGELAVISAEATAKGFNPHYMHETYVSDGRLPKFLVGLTAAFTILFITIGIPHMTVNAVQLVKDLKGRLNVWGRLTRGITSPLIEPFRLIGDFRHEFIQRQKGEEKKYLKRLAQADREEFGGDEDIEFTDEEVVEIRSVIDELKNQDQSWVQRCFRAIGNSRIIQFIRGPPDSFRHALGHFLFSSASLTRLV